YVRRKALVRVAASEAKPATRSDRESSKGRAALGGTLRGRQNLSDQLVRAAIDLAAEGGFENVRQRDVAARAGVTLRTLYKRFASKEELLAAALSQSTVRIEKRLMRKPVRGATPEERLAALFELLTRALCSRPAFARTVVRVMASGTPEVAAHILAFQGRAE